MFSFKLIYTGQCLYARDPRGETSVCVVLVLALIVTFVENFVCAEKCFLRVELPEETIESESFVIIYIYIYIYIILQLATK
jgi:hypothetical protein